MSSRLSIILCAAAFTFFVACHAPSTVQRARILDHSVKGVQLVADSLRVMEQVSVRCSVAHDTVFKFRDVVRQVEHAQVLVDTFIQQRADTIVIHELTASPPLSVLGSVRRLALLFVPLLFCFLVAAVLLKRL